jgi:uncharacterized protein (DUF1015 family)
LVHIHPFSGWRYAPELPLHLLVAPPFDAIDAVRQQVLHQKHPHNMVRLSRSWQNNPVSAANQLAEWQQTGVLQQDPHPRLYGYQHRWLDAQGTPQLRYGFLALVNVNDSIVPHEDTLYGPIQDRLAMLHATQTHTCPLFLLYRDYYMRINTALAKLSPPDNHIPWVQDDANVYHRVWPITDGATVDLIQTTLAERRLLIADGHHRFETLKQFHATHAIPGSAYALAYLANMNDPAMTVQPINRGFTLPMTSLRQALFKAFYPIPFPERQALTLHTRKWDMHFRVMCDVGSGIPVVQVEKLLFEKYLHTSTLELKEKGILRFYPQPEYPNPKSLLKTEGLSSVLYVRPPDLVTVLERCQKGFRLPLKSTYFYPKPMSGFVFYTF